MSFLHSIYQIIMQAIVNPLLDLYSQHPLLSKFVPFMVIASLLLLVSIYRYAGKAMTVWILFINLIVFSLIYFYIYL